MLRKLSLAIGLCAASFGVTATELVTNGSFEDSIIDAPAAYGWTLSSGVKRIPGLPTFARTGDSFIKFEEDELGETLSQSISGLTPGNTYTLSFWLLEGTDDSYSSFTASIAGQNKILKHGFDFPSLAWEKFTLDFVALSFSESLRFLSDSSDEEGDFFLDDVSITEKSGNGPPSNVPLPATLPLLGLGFLGLSLARRKMLR